MKGKCSQLDSGANIYPTFCVNINGGYYLSVICVRKKDDVITISADTAVCTDDTRKSVPGFKLFEMGGFVFGFVGFAEVPSLFRLFFSNYAIPEEFGLLEATQVVVAFSDFMKDIRPEYDPNHGAILIGTKKDVFVAEGFSIISVDDTYALGSGTETANVMLSLGATTHEAVNKACETNIWCYWPIETYIILDGAINYGRRERDSGRVEDYSQGGHVNE